MGIESLYRVWLNFKVSDQGASGVEDEAEKRLEKEDIEPIGVRWSLSPAGYRSGVEILVETHDEAEYVEAMLKEIIEAEGGTVIL